MSASDAWVSRQITVRRGDLDDRKSVVEDCIDLAGIVDEFDRTIPDMPDRARIADRSERREIERRPAIPAFRDDFGSDPGGVAERNR